MSSCPKCGSQLRRVHRTLREKFIYMGIFECRQCKARQATPRRFTYYFSENPRCPLCGTYKVQRLATRDRIDPMRKGLINLVQRIFRGDLYHCRFCRVQFYDRRKSVDVQRENSALSA